MKEAIHAATTIKNNIPSNGLSRSNDEQFFCYYFLDRVINIGEGVALLTANGLYHEAGIAARTALEGQLYFEAYKGDISLARLFRLFGVYEGYEETYRTALWQEQKRQRESNLDDWVAANAVAKAAADKWLEDDFKGNSPEAKSFAESAEQEFEFEKRGLKWHKKPLRDLVKSIKPVGYEEIDANSQSSEEELEELVEYISQDDPWGDLYYFSYHAFSQVAHWTTTGVTAWKNASNYINSALTATIHVLLTISAYVNDAHVDDKYKLNCSRDLILVGDRYERKGAETLRNLKSRKPA